MQTQKRLRKGSRVTVIGLNARVLKVEGDKVTVELGTSKAKATLNRKHIAP